MSGYPVPDLRFTETRRHMRALSTGGVVPILGVAVRKRDHFTRLWPTSDGGAPAGFLLAMLPVRLLAFGMLWGTSSPRRLAIPLLLAAVFAVHLLLSRYGHGLQWARLLAGER